MSSAILPRVESTVPVHVSTPRWPAILALGAALAAPAAMGQTFSFTGSLVSSDNTAPPNPPLITVNVPGFGAVDYFAWKSVDGGTGQVTAQAGWVSLAGVAPANLSFDFGDLELTELVFGAGTATEYYGETDGSPRYFGIYNGGALIATGNDFSLEIVTDTNPGSPNFTKATGTAAVTLAAVGGHPFVENLVTLQGGSAVLEMQIAEFTAPVEVWNDRSEFNFAIYDITGGGAAKLAPVPEPVEVGSVGAMVLAGVAGWRRWRSSRGAGATLGGR